MNLRGFIKFVLRKDTTFHGEYGLVQRLLPKDCPKVVVDVGASDGFYGSNSYPFAARSWSALLIEPHPETFRKLRHLHRRRRSVTCLNMACADTDGPRPFYFGTKATSHSTLSTEDTPRFRALRSDKSVMVDVRRLEGVLSEHGIPSDFGLLSIDAESFDYEVLLGLDLGKWRPRVIVTEGYESKDKLKCDYLQLHNYRLGGTRGSNSFWAVKD
jgi:FkbM family methyltransferase